MADLRIALNKVKGFEGLISNDKNDKGGYTYKGIAYNMHPKWDGWKIVFASKSEKDFPDCLEANYKLQKTVDEFYKNEFWDELNGGDIPNQSVANQLFDMAVNAGVSTSIKLFQRSMGLKETGKMDKDTMDKISLIA